MITFLFVTAAVAVALWPSKKTLEKILPDELQKNTPPHTCICEPKADQSVSFLEAVAALQVVRGRLEATDELDQPSCDACNILTLGLSAGSHKK